MSQPYEPAPPVAPGAFTNGPSGPRAGFWARFGAAFVDGLILLVPSLIIFAAFGRDSTGGQALQTLIGIAYFVFFEGGPTGATPGKRALGIRVYDLRNGGPIGYGRAFIRYIGRIVSAIPLLLGFFWMLWDKEKQAWHDKFATCIVVPTDVYQ
jgi:uncharacterized RDD family membrane protein YckC